MPARRPIRLLIASLILLDVLSMSSASRLAKGAESSSEQYSVESRTVARVTGVLRFDVTVPSVRAKEWIVCVSQAPTLPGQAKVQTRLEPGGKPLDSGDPQERGLLITRIEADAGKFENALPIRLSYEATLKARKLRRGRTSGRVPALSAEERKSYLLNEGLIDFEAAGFRDWMSAHDCLRGQDEGDVRFARRIFLALKSSMQYDHAPSMDWHASIVCKSGRTDCAGMSVLFAAIMRANRIPARTLWGRWAYSAEPGKMLGGKPYYQTHVKAEFFARGIGWIPVDLSSAVLHDRTPQGLKYFGNDPGDFLAFHVDSNFEVNTVAFGIKPVVNLQKPVFWVRGKGSLKGQQVLQDWKVRRTSPRRS